LALLHPLQVLKDAYLQVTTSYSYLFMKSINP
jgi:hypothetical protein